MIFEQYCLSRLAQVSYLVGSDGVVAVVDPHHDAALVLAEARRLGVRITHVVATHVDADRLSVLRELASRAGARIVLSAGADVAFPHVSVLDGDAIDLGQCRLRFLETPSETPASLCVAVINRERPEEPFAVIGDTLFVDDVGSSDLGATATPAELAAMLCDTLQRKILTLPDAVAIHPGMLVGVH